MVMRGKGRIRGMGCVGRVRTDEIEHSLRKLQSVSGDDFQSIKTGTEVCNRGAGRNNGCIISGNIGYDIADNPRPGQRREPSTLDHGKMLADDIYGRDRRSDASSSSFSAISSARANPGGGAGRSAEPTPQINASTRSSLDKSDTVAFNRCAASSPAMSGTG